MLQKELIFQRFPDEQLVIELTADDDYTGINAVFLSVLTLGIPVRYSLFCVAQEQFLGVFEYKTREFEILDGDVNASKVGGNICHGYLSDSSENVPWRVGNEYDEDENVSSAERCLVEAIEVQLVK